MVCTVTLVKALVTWAVKTLVVTHVNQSESLFHSGRQNHRLILVFKEKGATHYFPHVKREPLRRNETALCVKHWLPVPKQHALIGGTKNKVGKTTEV